MTLHYVYGAWRHAALWAWIFFCWVVVGFWIGPLALAICLPATRWLRHQRGSGIQCLRLTDESGEAAIRQVWLLPGVLWIQTRSGAHWLWRDEVSAREWAAVRRYLRVHLPAQPLGLTISS